MRWYENNKYKEDLEIVLQTTKGIEQLRGKRILVAGATGLIGSFLVDALLYANDIYHYGIKVVACSRSVEKLTERFGPETSDLKYLIGDVCQENCYNDKLDYVIHLASNAYPEKFRREPVETMLGNIMGTLNLLKLTQRSDNCRMLYVSTGEVYGEVDKHKDEEDYGYIDILSARSCYPMSKRAGETLCSSYAEEYNVDVVIARPCHVYGPNGTENDNRASTQFIQKAVRTEDIIMNSSGSQIRSYIYVADCVSGLLTVLLKGKCKVAYNVAPADVISIRGFADICAREANVRVIVHLTDETGKKEQSPISSQILVSKKLYGLGWKERYTIEEGIGRSIEILRSRIG